MSSETDSYVEYEVDGPVATITLNRPDKLNAITLPRQRELTEAIRRFDRDPKLHIAVLRGKGRSFCAGRDLKYQAESGESPTKEVESDLTNYGLPHTDKILVTSAKGHAIGAGGYFLMAGDVRIVSDTIQFGLLEVPTAVLGPYWIAVAERLPPAVAFRVAVIGDMLSPDELVRYGLVTELVPEDDLEDATRRWVERLLELPPQHAKATMRLMRELGYRYTREAFARDQEVRGELDALADTREAALAFKEARKPSFIDG